MTLVDTSVWLDHFNSPLSSLAELIRAGYARTHPLVIGEIAMGSWKLRARTLAGLKKLPQVKRAQHDEVLWLVDVQKLHGSGLSFIDAHLLASVRINRGCQLWTRDKRLRAAATQLGIASPLD